LTRRTLLRGVGLAGVAAFLPNCGGDGVAPSPSPTALTQQAVEAAILGAIGSAGVRDYSVLVAMSEVLTDGQRIQFAVTDADRALLSDVDIDTWVVRVNQDPADLRAEIVLGPVQPTFHGEGLDDKGVYVVEGDLPEVGQHEIVVATRDGAHVGIATINVIDARDSDTPKIDDRMPSVATPTTAEPGDGRFLCTREVDGQPAPCGMHELSLADALDARRPVVLVISTPKYCASRVCGPVIEVVEAERLARPAPDQVAWIHVEPFVDPTVDLPQAVPLLTELSLPSEPWIFIVGADRRVVDRFDGPAPADLFREALGRV